MFDVGLDFRELGRLTGVLAGRVLAGTDPATIPIRDAQHEVPRRLVVNLLAARGLRQPWTIPRDVARTATVLVDETGTHARTPPPTHAALAKTWRIDLVQFNNVLDVEESQEGVLAGLREAGLVEGRDYVTTVRNAQGDMATVSGLIDAALSEHADLLITFSTPTLQAALQRARSVPIVFNYLASPIAAGAGTSDTDHLPNVTGVYMAAAFKEMLALIRACLPAARTLGTLLRAGGGQHGLLQGSAAGGDGESRLRADHGGREHELGSVGRGAGAGQPASRCDLPDPGEPDGGGLPEHRAGGTAGAAPGVCVSDEPGPYRREPGRRTRLPGQRPPGCGARRTRHARRTTGGPALSSGHTHARHREPRRRPPRRPRDPTPIVAHAAEVIGK